MVLDVMREDTATRLTAVWTACGTAIYLVAPRSAPLLLSLAIAAPVAWCDRARLRAHLSAPYPLGVVLSVATAYLAINATWSLAQTFAWAAVGVLLFATLILHIARIALPLAGARALRAMAVGTYVGYALSALFICSEMLDRFWLLTHWSATVKAPSGIAAGELPPHFLNHSLAALALLAWPALIAAWQLGATGRTRTLMVVGLAPAVIAILASQHATAKIAALGGCAVFGLHMLAPRACMRLLQAAWLIACLAIVPLAAAMYSAQLYTADWLALSARHRIVIWGYTSQQVVKAPIFGSGVAAARGIADTQGPGAAYAPNSDIVLSTSVHAHNAYLQVWFETGLVGAILLLAIGLTVLRNIATAPAPLQPALAAAFAAAALLAGSSFSIWAPWFLASFALAGIYAISQTAAISAGPGDEIA